MYHNVIELTLKLTNNFFCYYYYYFFNNFHFRFPLQIIRQSSFWLVFFANFVKFYDENYCFEIVLTTKSVPKSDTNSHTSELG